MVTFKKRRRIGWSPEWAHLMIAIVSLSVTFAIFSSWRKLRVWWLRTPHLKSLLWSSFMFEVLITLSWPKSNECHIELMEPLTRKEMIQTKASTAFIWCTVTWHPSVLNHIKAGLDLACNEGCFSHSRSYNQLLIRGPRSSWQLYSQAFSILIKQWCMAGEQSGKQTEINVLLALPLWPRRAPVRGSSLIESATALVNKSEWLRVMVLLIKPFGSF